MFELLKPGTPWQSARTRSALAALLTGLLASHSAIAQDAGESAPTTIQRPRILYIEVPVALRPETVSIAPVSTAFPFPDELTSVDIGDSALEEYRFRIAELETEGGAWDSSLVEQLTALGTIQQTLGDHGRAIEQFQRAMHIDRVNNGLHSLDQVPVVERLIESHTALTNWSEVDLYQNYLFYVQERAYGGEDPRLIPVLEQLASWNLSAFTLGFGEFLGLRLSAAQMLFTGAARLVGANYGPEDSRYIDNLHNIARSAHLAARYPEYVIAISRPDHRAVQDDLRAKLNTTAPAVPRGFAAGYEALNEIVELRERPGSQDTALAAALINLADWNVIFERRQSARDLYHRAWEILSSGNHRELMSLYFGQVTMLPAFAQMPTNLVLGSNEARENADLKQDYADVSLSVTEFGVPRDIEILSPESDANSRQLNQLRREIRKARFRPILVNGEPVRATGQVFRYRYWY